MFVFVCLSVGPLKTLLLTPDLYHLLPAGSPEMPLNLIVSPSQLRPPARSPACLPEINAKEEKRKKRTRNKQQYNNRIFLGLISSASAELQGKRLACRCLLSIHYLALSGAAAARHGINHSSSRRPKECHHQSASALNCQSAASPLFTEGSFSSYPFFSFDLLFISVSPPCPFSFPLHRRLWPA